MCYEQEFLKIDFSYLVIITEINIDKCIEI